MSKIGLIGDLHIGARNGSNYFRQFFRVELERIFSELSTAGVTDLYQLGDLFDSRRSINVMDIHFVLDEVVPMLEEHQLTLHVLGGNHDIMSSDHSRFTSLRLLMGQPRVNIIMEPVTEVTEVGDLAIVPWMNKSNEQEALDFMASTPAEYMIGHFEIVGMRMYANSIESTHGLDPNVFESFEGVFSGHYHHPSTHRNIGYLGSPWHLTWSDVLDTKGYYLFDGENLEFCETTNSLFIVHEYDETGDFDPAVFEGCIVKVVCNERTNEKKWNKFKKSLGEVKTIDHTIIDNVVLDTTTSTISEEDLSVDATGALKTYVEGIEGVDHAPLTEYMTDLHTRSVGEL